MPPLFELSEPQRAEAHALERDHRVADGLEHPPHLALAALVDGDLDAVGRESLHARGCRPPVVELDALAQRPQRVVAHGRAPHLGVVGARDLERGVREPVRERAVVGQQDEPGGVGVEPAHRVQPPGAGDERDDRRPALRVVGGRDHAARLVDGVDGALAGRDAHRLAVDLDRHAAVDIARRVAHELAAHRHTAREHELLGGAPRGDTRVGEVLGEAH